VFRRPFTGHQPALTAFVRSLVPGLENGRNARLVLTFAGGKNTVFVHRVMLKST
jgi:hypothetical protein